MEVEEEKGQEELDEKLKIFTDSRYVIDNDFLIKNFRSNFVPL